MPIKNKPNHSTESDQGESSHKIRRMKERTITEIIMKVSTWRKLYNGVMIPVIGPKDKKQLTLQRWSL